MASISGSNSPKPNCSKDRNCASAGICFDSGSNVIDLSSFATVFLSEFWLKVDLTPHYNLHKKIPANNGLRYNRRGLIGR